MIIGSFGKSREENPVYGTSPAIHAVVYSEHVFISWRAGSKATRFFFLKTGTQRGTLHCAPQILHGHAD